MNNYDFSTLNDKEFEQISKDLLNAKYKLGLQDFKVGKDKGIDLRFSTSKNHNSIIAQVKHYVGSGFSQLKHTLISRELHKIKILKPDRYLVVTSLPLSATQKDEIKEALDPFIISANDIFGQEDLNGVLNEFKEIEKNYFKLWFSSITVLNAVINNAIEGRTKYMMERIKEKIPFYVVTKKLDDANKILQKEKLLLITGQPGIGKTTLAEIILFDRAKNGFKIYKVENITEAEDVISPNPDEKELFYFDDFLGANYFEIINAHKTETQLTSFVERVKIAPNKYLILTTRTIILNQALERYEKINYSKLSNQQFEIKLTDYTKYEKALILYNHLYFRKVKEELLDSIIANKFYNTVILHKNYTPRIIEFITDKSRIEKLTSVTYRQFIINNLNNPKEIWRYSFNNQIEYLDKCLLLTLFTFENDTFESSLATAFENRLQYEKTEHNQIITANQFHESTRILLNGFITSSLYDTSPPERGYRFINPSLTDFLIGYVFDSYSERKSILSSIIYVEQLSRFNPDKRIIPLEKELQGIIRDKISKGQLHILESHSKSFTENKRQAIYLEVLSKYCYLVNTDTLLLEYFKKITFSENWSPILSKIEYLLVNMGDAPQTFSYIKENFIRIIEKMINTISEYKNAVQIPILFGKYQHDYHDYTTNLDGGFQSIINMIESVLLESEDDLREQHEDEITDLHEISKLYEEIRTLGEDLLTDLFPNRSVEHDFNVDMDWDYWERRVKENAKKSDIESSRFDDYDEDYYREAAYERNEDNAVDDLFSKSE
jgi:hypothetical protein